MNVMKEDNYRDKISFLTFLSIILIMVFLSGCGYREGTLQKSDKSYLWFTGNTENAVVFMDNKEFVRLDVNADRRDQIDVPIHYQIEPGKHEIRIERDGKVILNRVMILGSQMTREVEVP